MVTNGLSVPPESSDEFEKGKDALTKVEWAIMKMYLKGMQISQISEARVCTDNLVYKRLASSCRKFGYQKQKGQYYNEIRQQVVDLFIQYAPGYVNHAAFGRSSLSNQLIHDSTSIAYVARPKLEQPCYEAMIKSGGLCRVKGPGGTGKTMLQNQMLAQLSTQNFDTVALSFSMASRTVFEHIDSFLKWLCASVSRELSLPNRVNECWDDILSANSSATEYFETCILEGREKPLVLALDDMDRVFEHEEVAIDFCQLLRGWHLKARNNTRMSPLWKKLRLLLVHSTDIYGAMDINASPLSNVGTVISVKEFTSAQVHDLARQTRIPWPQLGAEDLEKLLEGHPALVSLTLDHLGKTDHLEKPQSLAQILETAHTDTSIYTSYLRDCLERLRQAPKLAKAFQSIIESSQPIQVGTDETFQLERMGLIRVNGDDSVPRNLLYRRYFHHRLFS